MYNGQSGAGFATAGPPSLPTIVDDQTAHELYLKAYEYPVTQAQPSSIMCSYQGFQIVPFQQSAAWASDNPLTLTTILRGQWKFPGFVLSDYGAVHSVHALLSGLDMEYATTSFATQLPALVTPGSASYNPLYAQALDEAVAYVLYSDERFGLLGGASANGAVSGSRPPPRPNIEDIKSVDAAITERVSEESAVLLKNDGDLLPLKDSNLHSVAIIGPTARQVMVYGGQGERARGFPDRDAISPLQILRTLAPKGSQFTSSAGIHCIVPLVSSAGGLGALACCPMAMDGFSPSAFSPAGAVSTFPSDVVPAGGDRIVVTAALAAGVHKIFIFAFVSSKVGTPVYLPFALSKLGD